MNFFTDFVHFSYIVVKKAASLFSDSFAEYVAENLTVRLSEITVKAVAFTSRERNRRHNLNEIGSSKNKDVQYI